MIRRFNDPVPRTLDSPRARNGDVQARLRSRRWGPASRVGLDIDWRQTREALVRSSWLAMRRIVDRL